MHAHALAVKGFLLVAILAETLFAQQNGRFADLKAKGFGAFEKGQYAEVAGTLEQVWEEDQSDPKVAEYLAMGYLYGERDIAKARPLLDKAIALGGQASFLVSHSHEHLSILQDDLMTNLCMGKLSISLGKIVFVPDSGEHHLQILPADLKDFTIPNVPPGRIHIKAGGKNFTFRVKSQTRGEALLLGQIAERNLKR